MESMLALVPFDASNGCFQTPNGVDHYYAPPEAGIVYADGTVRYVLVSVQAGSDAHLGLFPYAVKEGVDDSGEFYEFAIGCRSNSRSAIRRSRRGANAALVSCPVLDAGGFVDFWASVDVASGRVAMGRGHDILQAALMEFIDRSPLPPASFAVMTCREGASGVWRFPRPTSSTAATATLLAPPASPEFEDGPCFNCKGSGRAAGVKCCICCGKGREPVAMPALSVPAPESPVASAVAVVTSSPCRLQSSPPGYGQGLAGLYASMVLTQDGGGVSQNAASQSLVPLADVAPPTSFAPLEDEKPSESPAEPSASPLASPASPLAEAPWKDAPPPAVEAPEVARARERAARGRANASLVLRQAAERRRTALAAAEVAASAEVARRESLVDRELFYEAFSSTASGAEPRRLKGKQRVLEAEASPLKVVGAARIASPEIDQDMALLPTPSRRPHCKASPSTKRRVSGKRALPDGPGAVSTSVEEEKPASKRSRKAR